MSTEPQAQAEAKQATTVEASVLDSAISETTTRVVEVVSKQDKQRIEGLVDTLMREVLQGAVTYDKSTIRTIRAAIEACDAKLSTQLAAIMHHPKFQQTEGTWRGLHYLVMNSETGTQLKIKMLNISKKELFKDLDKAAEFDQSELFKKLYEYEFGMPGGEPYGALIGDYYFENHPEDIALLGKVSGVAAAAFCPFISGTSPKLLGLDSFTELSKPRDLAKTFMATEYVAWRSYRDSEDSRFVALTMPRVLARLPYGANTKPIEEFAFEEVELDRAGRGKPVAHDHYCWMNASYVLGARLTEAFAKDGFCVAIRGLENGGKVEGLPAHTFVTDEGDTDLKCPTELGITDRREKELSDLGFLSLCHYKNTDYAVFFGAQTTQKPKKYDRKDATDNAAISARLPYLMAVSRFAHYLKVIARDKIGSFMEVSDCQSFLERWIAQYVCADAKPTAEQKRMLPLAAAKIEVQEVGPGSYRAIAHLRPWLQLEELTASLRLVARIPTRA
ncbi:MAG: type VI secretion system contractile sheath large subunit [Planctomycetes bacterium]|nr:type VI secretion system contractile sheath large subunit [Planctomycetota bacterium]